MTKAVNVRYRRAVRVSSTEWSDESGYVCACCTWHKARRLDPSFCVHWRRRGGSGRPRANLVGLWVPIGARPQCVWVLRHPTGWLSPNTIRVLCTSAGLMVLHIPSLAEVMSSAGYYVAHFTVVHFRPCMLWGGIITYRIFIMSWTRYSYLFYGSVGLCQFKCYVYLSFYIYIYITLQVSHKKQLRWTLYLINQDSTHKT